MNDELKKFLQHFEEHGLPGMKSSAMCISILGDKPDAKICLEVGAAVLLDKPLIVAIKPGAAVPANIKRVASAIVEVSADINDKAMHDKIAAAIDHVLKNDPRIRKPRGMAGVDTDAKP